MKPTPLRRGKLEIEPLSEARWARVERAVFQEMARPDPEADRAAPEAELGGGRWRFAAVLVMAGALAAIAGGLAWRTFVPAAHEGATRVETAANGSRVDFGESTIDVGPLSVVRLSGDDAHGVLVTLDRGRVECDVAPRHERPAFVVEAGTVEVRVVGTHFTVSRGADGVAVDVQRGLVEVTCDGRSDRVSAGEHWPALAAEPPAAPPSAPSSAAPAPAVRDAIHAEPRPAAHAPAFLSPRDQYEAASRLESHQPEAAVAAYRELARQGGAWGENALFAAGRLEADRGDQDDARRLLREYLGRYPSGPNAADARQLLDRLR